MPLTFPPVLQPPGAQAQQAVNATGPWRAAVEQYVQQQAGQREHLLTPSDFACVADGPWVSTAHYAGLCLPSLRYQGDGRQTAYALLSHSAYVDMDAACDATVGLTWIPRVTGVMHFDVWLGGDGDAQPVQPEATSVGIVAGGADAGHWMCAHATIPAPSARPGGALVLTVSSHVPIDVDLIAASVSIRPRPTNA